jgi:hypothetical protein
LSDFIILIFVGMAHNDKACAASGFPHCMSPID